MCGTHCVNFIVVHSDDTENTDKKVGDNTDRRGSLPNAGMTLQMSVPSDGGARRTSPDYSAALGSDYFDDFDWDLESAGQDESKTMTEEILKKRLTVMKEKVSILS